MLLMDSTSAQWFQAVPRYLHCQQLREPWVACGVLTCTMDIEVNGWPFAFFGRRQPLPAGTNSDLPWEVAVMINCNYRKSEWQLHDSAILHQRQKESKAMAMNHSWHIGFFVGADHHCQQGINTNQHVHAHFLQLSLDLAGMWLMRVMTVSSCNCLPVEAPMQRNPTFAVQVEHSRTHVREWIPRISRLFFHWFPPKMHSLVSRGSSFASPQQTRFETNTAFAVFQTSLFGTGFETNASKDVRGVQTPHVEREIARMAFAKSVEASTFEDLREQRGFRVLRKGHGLIWCVAGNC